MNINNNNNNNEANIMFILKVKKNALCGFYTYTYLLYLTEKNLYVYIFFTSMCELRACLCFCHRMYDDSWERKKNSTFYAVLKVVEAYSLIVFVCMLEKFVCC